ncbi:DUF3298 and DUF4163 domain-containing protein [Hymenobacter tibetensis]|uniref:DUF3298 and DUF4163 domain-containing protein n=1 Tax=Hymenobacter tibetensis TaxID=497967 RepID=A0ABY4CU50_9BACT|nr:DUF3298 and DUF4163 domain-containing protein [Hymenobacter tibetensis]UOG73803.1 DUF3298 and DUF4163 domain-containing protein [Hymenobacter tibetensis]
MSFPTSLVALRFAVLCMAGLFTACQSNTNSGAAATTVGNEQALAPATLQNSAGTWYRCYRGTVGPDTVTLHLQTWPTGFENRNQPTFFGCYSGADGQPHELTPDFDAVSSSDSVLVRDHNPSLLNEEANGPLWRLKLNGNELTGTRAAHPIRLREVQLPGSIALVSRYFTDSLAAFPKQPKSPHGRISLHTLLPANNSESERKALMTGMLRGLRGDTLDSQAAPASLEQYWQQQKSAFAKDYRADAADLAQDRPTEPDSSAAPSYDYMLRYEDQTVTHVFWNQDNLLSVGFFTYSYTGGAHGNYGTRATTFDMRTGKALRYADIFRPDATVSLSNLLDQAVRRTLRQTATTKLDEFLFVKKMPVSHNVYLTRSGAIFIYTPYEIASYAQGEIQVFVPLEQLRPLLRPGLPWGGGEISQR